MVTSRTLATLAIALTMGAVSAQPFHPSLPGKETTTRPWTAPIGHRQPRAGDVPNEKNLSNPNDPINKEDALLDKKIKSICRGC